MCLFMPEKTVDEMLALDVHLFVWKYFFHYAPHVLDCGIHECLLWRIHKFF